MDSFFIFLSKESNSERYCPDPYLTYKNYRIRIRTDTPQSFCATKSDVIWWYFIINFPILDQDTVIRIRWSGKTGSIGKQDHSSKKINSDLYTLYSASSVFLDFPSFEIYWLAVFFVAVFLPLLYLWHFYRFMGSQAEIPINLDSKSFKITEENMKNPDRYLDFFWYNFNLFFLWIKRNDIINSNHMVKISKRGLCSDHKNTDMIKVSMFVTAWVMTDT